MNADVLEIWSEVYHDAGYVVRDEKHRSHFEEMDVVPLDDTDMSEDTAEVVSSLKKSLDVHKGHTMRMTVAYTMGGDYIGTPESAKKLCDELGIYPEKAKPADNVCSIGFSRKNKKWYGWSHRAIYGFTVGDTVKEGDCTASSGWTEEYLKEHPEEDLALPVGFIAKTFEDAKRMAIAFAESVG